MSKVYNVMIVGVGGQGSLLASRILGNYFLAKGLDVKVSEVHGMAQRGGSVVTYVRAGESVASPLVTPGEADLVISFEELEALRHVHNLKKGGRVVVSTQRIMPMPVITGAAKYPENVLDELRSADVEVTALDALDLAVNAGGAKAANVALMGAAARVVGGEVSEWEDVIRAIVKPQFIDMNLRAFEAGYKAQ